MLEVVGVLPDADAEIHTIQLQTGTGLGEDDGLDLHGHTGDCGCR
jgi:hypothetical protein